MQYFPLFFDLNHKPVLVIGGGEVASRKVEMLMRAGASVTIVAPQVTPFLKQCIEQEKCVWINEKYRDDLLTDYVQVWATTNDIELNHKVHKYAKSKGVMVNVVDDKPYCDFITPSIVNRGKIQIAISSGGASPVLTRNIREKIETVLGQNVSLLAEFAESKRTDIKAHYPTVTERRLFWEAYFSDGSVEVAETAEQLEATYQKHFSKNSSVTPSLNWVEFGNDVELLSLKTLRVMQQAEVVYYPESCGFDFIDLCRRDAERFQFSSKEHLLEILQESKQSEINNICILIPKDSSEYSSGVFDECGSGKVYKVIG